MLSLFEQLQKTLMSFMQSTPPPAFLSLDWFSQKTQIDFGNALVGIATMMIALTTLYISIKSSKRDSGYKISQFRQEWINNLRDNTSKFVKITDSLTADFMDIIAKKKILGQSFLEKTRMNLADLASIDTHMRLSFNLNEKNHDLCFSLLSQTKGLLCLSLVNLEDGEHQEAEDCIRKVNQLRFKIPDIVSIILKEEWQRIKIESQGKNWKKNINNNTNLIIRDSESILESTMQRGS
jgi:hypothetical protein